MKINDVYVAHCCGSIMFIGTKKQCEKHQASQKHATDSWNIQTVDVYGDSRYSEGYDNGYDCGYEQGVEV